MFSYTTVRNRSLFKNTNTETYCVNAQFPTALGQMATPDLHILLGETITNVYLLNVAHVSYIIQRIWYGMV